MRTASVLILVVALPGGSTALAVQSLGVFGPVTLEVRSQPIYWGGYEHLTKHTISVNSPVAIQSFDFRGNGSSCPCDSGAFGFFGPMLQLNPFLLSTVFEDWNALAPIIEVPLLDESQFKFRSQEVIVAAGSAFESRDVLQAAFEFPQPLTGLFDLVQVALPNNQPIRFRGRIEFPPETGQSAVFVEWIPEPVTLVLMGWAVVGLTFMRHRDRMSS